MRLTDDVLAPLPALPQLRLPPHSLDAEQATLGSMLMGGPDIIGEVIAQVATDAFFFPSHQILFDGIRSLHESGHAVDPITFTQQIRDAGLVEKVGGTMGAESGPGEWYITRLFTIVPNASLVGHYLEILRDKWLARQMIKTCERAISTVYERADKTNATLETLQGDVIELNNLLLAKDPLRHIKDFVPDAVKQIKAAYEKRGQITGLPTGFVDYDRMTNGLEPGYVYVFGARPAMGKTSWALGIAEYIAVENAANGNTVQFFSLEMTGTQIARRLLCAAASVSIADIRFGFLGKDELPKIEAAAERLVRSHVIIDDKAGLNVFEFRARARRAVKKRGAKVILIDYLQMMHGVSRRAAENRQAEVSEVMQAIAETAKELQVPIVVLAQLSRKAEDRKWGVPEMSDLRESGDIENYAHLIGLLWRPIYYAATDAQKDQLCEALTPKKPAKAHPGMAEPEPMTREKLETYAQIMIVKQREGPTRPCPIRFVPEFTRFESYTEKLFSNDPQQRQKPPP